MSAPSVESAIEGLPCLCGHSQEDHDWPGYPECMAGDNDLGDVFCACRQYTPATAANVAAGPGGRSSSSQSVRNEA